MRTLFALLLTIAVVFSTDCNPSLGSNDVNPGCIDSETPYCRQTKSNPATFTCVACMSHCDCDLGEYCSSDVGTDEVEATIGTCVSFEPVCSTSDSGCECRTLTDAQLLDPNIPDSFKCGVISNSPSGRIVDVNGVCNGGSCEICNSYASTGGRRLSSCSADAGTRPARTCTPGGSFVHAHYFRWAPSVYYEDPVSVWLAIFFPFIVLLFVIQFLTCQRTGLTN